MKLIIEEKDLLDAFALAFEFGKITVADANKDLHARNVQQSLLGRNKLRMLKSFTLDEIVKELSATIIPTPFYGGGIYGGGLQGIQGGAVPLRKTLNEYEGGFSTCEGKVASSPNDAWANNYEGPTQKL